MTELIQSNNVRAVTIDRPTTKLTNGQKKLLEIIKKCLSDGSPLKMEDIENIYTEECIAKERTNYGKWVYHGHKIPQTWVVLTREQYIKENLWRAKYHARTWLKLNLGACIIKGKILMLPVIED